MSKVLGGALRAARERRGLNQAAVADEMKVSRAAVGQWERGVNEPSTAHLIHLCDFLGLNITAATGGLVRLEEYPPAEGEADSDDRAYKVTDRRPEMRDAEIEAYRFAQQDAALNPVGRHIPIIETAGVVGHISVSDSKGRSIEPDFIIGKEIVDLCPRPPGLPHVKKLEAIFVTDEKNSPRFEMGDLIIFQDGRTGKINEYVLVRFEFGPTEEEGGGDYAIIGKIVAKTLMELTIEQLNPRREVTIYAPHILGIDRIIPFNELFGK